MNREDAFRTMNVLTGIDIPITWRPVSKGGLSSNKNQTQTNLVRKAVETVSTVAAPSSNPSGGLPLQVLTVSAVESPSKQQDRTYSQVSVSFTRNTSDVNFASVKIWFIGYQGSASPTLVADGATSPITFLVETTKETVTVKVQAVSPTGLTSNLTFAPITTVTLDGVVSTPPAPTVSQTLLGTPVGYQFQFAYEGGLLADVIQGYNIYRNTSNTTSGATLIKNVPQPAQNSGVYTYQEAVPTGTVYYYFVSAVNISGLESAKTSAQSGSTANGSNLDANGQLSLDTGVKDGSTYARNAGTYGQNLLENPSFEFPPASNTSDLTAGWFVQGNTMPTLFGAANNTEGSPYIFSGTKDIYTTARPNISVPASSTQYVAIQTRKMTPARTGQQYVLHGKARADQSVATPAGLVGLGNFFARVHYSDATISEFDTPSVALGAGYQDLTIAFTVPAAPAGQTVLGITVWFWSRLQNTTGAAISTPNGLIWDVRFDHVELVRASTMDDEIADGSTFRRVKNVDADNTFHVTTSFLKQGSLVQVSDNKLSYTSTSTSITWSWTAFTIYAPDGSTIAVSSGSQAFSSLSPSTTYKFGFYVDLSNNTVHVVLSDVTGGTGNASVQQIVQTLNADGRVPITLNVAGATPAGGSGGGGGGVPTCFSPDTKVRTQRGNVAFRDLAIDDSILTARGTWKRIAVITERSYGGEALDMGREAVVTPGHLILHGGAWVRADSLNRFPKILYCGPIMNLHVDADENDDGTKPDTEHSYTLESGLVVHNIITT